jgi:hypothetical protein
MLFLRTFVEIIETLIIFVIQIKCNLDKVLFCEEHRVEVRLDIRTAVADVAVFNAAGSIK